MGFWLSGRPEAGHVLLLGLIYPPIPAYDEVPEDVVAPSERERERMI